MQRFSDTAAGRVEVPDKPTDDTPVKKMAELVNQTFTVTKWRQVDTRFGERALLTIVLDDPDDISHYTESGEPVQQTYHVWATWRVLAQMNALSGVFNPFKATMLPAGKNSYELADPPAASDEIPF